MKIAYGSDLHIEHRGNPKFDPQDADVIVLAGDIHLGVRAVSWAEALPGTAPVIYVAGNHESYGSDITTTYEMIEAAAEESDRVHFLENGCHTIGDTIFIGATMWTNYALLEHLGITAETSMELAQTFMNDHRVITANAMSSLFTPTLARARHIESVAFIEKALRANNGGTKRVVISHHAPSIKSVAPRFAGEISNVAYASSLEHLVEEADLWIHGHMHEPVNYTLCAGHVVSNPCGYPGEREAYGLPEFNAAFVEI